MADENFSLGEKWVGKHLRTQLRTHTHTHTHNTHTYTHTHNTHNTHTHTHTHTYTLITHAHKTPLRTQHAHTITPHAHTIHHTRAHMRTIITLRLSWSSTVVGICTHTLWNQYLLGPPIPAWSAGTCTYKPYQRITQKQLHSKKGQPLLRHLLPFMCLCSDLPHIGKRDRVACYDLTAPERGEK